MASTRGAVTFDFGAAPGTNIVTATVSDAAVGAGADIEIFLSGLDSTADHNAYEHSLLAFLGNFQATAIAKTDGVGFTAQAATELRLTGTVKARYVQVT